jgi:hypothetical protein
MPWRRNGYEYSRRTCRRRSLVVALAVAPALWLMGCGKTSPPARRGFFSAQLESRGVSRPSTEAPVPPPGTTSDRALLPLSQPFSSRLRFTPLVQQTLETPSLPAPLLSGFKGLVGGIPNTDANGAVGKDAYLEMINDRFAFFSKAGAPLPDQRRAIRKWVEDKDICGKRDAYDPIVLYDNLNSGDPRWVLTRLLRDNPSSYVCIAISMSDKPSTRFAYYAYFFPGRLLDYPKFGVWWDGYYASFNFKDGDQARALVCVFDRAQLRKASPNESQPVDNLCVEVPAGHASLLPSDFEGTLAPPAGSPALFLDSRDDHLFLWKFHVDWKNLRASSLTGPLEIPVDPFVPACIVNCIPQPNPWPRLRGIGDRLMYRLAYRNFGDHESLVTNQSVSVEGAQGGGPRTGIRWYELHDPSRVPKIFQQGTFAPGRESRWMGSAAMDRQGNLGLAYSISSPTLSPGIRFAYRLRTDPPGVLSREMPVLQGKNQQTTMWGDYSSLRVDPTDDCTFWFQGAYMATDGVEVSTYVAHIRLPGCPP